ncbi:MAG TPA: DEAD/DEAH box helicase [Bacilli bacterium]|nr:DEAD/DEAH box helicase [Bacilli bacterium]
MNTFAVVDLETTGNSANKGDRIIEIAIVIYRDGEVIKQYSQLVNPNQHISRFISYLTSITNDMVTGQPVFAELAHEIHQHFEDVYFVAHNVPFDLGFLNYELKQAGLSPITQPIIDTVELSRILLPQAPSFKLGHLADWLNITHDDPHRALSDALVTTKLLDYLLAKLKTLPLATIKQLSRLAPDLKSQLEMILLKQVEETKQNTNLNDQFSYAYHLAYKPIDKIETSIKKQRISFGNYLDQLFNDQSKLQNLIPNYEERPGQREMAEAIYHAFQSEQHALIEAGTGTGKTLAYLIAACFQAVQHNEKVLISTYLIQLQEQLLNQEWSQLKKALPFDCHVAILKGKNHYLNLAKFSQALHEESYNYDQVLTKAIILVWLTETNSGDIDEIQLPSSGSQLFKRVSASHDSSTAKTYHSVENIYYQTAQKAAETADLLIVNHSLLADSMQREHGLLNLHEKLIIDEAHHLEDVVASQFGLQLNSVMLHKKLKAIDQFIELTSISDRMLRNNLQKFTSVAIEENDLLFNYLYHLDYSQPYQKP